MMIEAIKKVIDKKGRELSLSGSDIDNHDEELKDGLNQVPELNLLRISKSQLTSLPTEVFKLTNLVSLVCQNNKLESLSSDIGLLTKLKLLDLSNNHLVALPAEIGKLTNLTTLNVSCNKLVSFPLLTDCLALGSLDASHNQLTEFPKFHDQLTHFVDLTLSENLISEIPLDLSKLQSLRSLLLENNKILTVPGNIMDCPKLKILKLTGNELKDRRFRKLVENSNTKPEQVMKYIKQNCPRIAPTNKTSETDEEDSMVAAVNNLNVKSSVPTIKISSPEDDLYITVFADVIRIRPYVVSCLVRGMDLQDDRFKRFLSEQNKLHDTVCNKRLNSTIATHDLSKIQLHGIPSEGQNTKEGLMFRANNHEQLKFLPLNCRSKPLTIKRYVQKLHLEADAHRKQQKANSNLGLYKYLDLVARWTEYPCMMDAQDNVLSVPPLTNGDISKISPASTDVLLEVTSGTSLKFCKDAMTSLIQACLMVTPKNEDGEVVLSVQQVRVVDDTMSLRCIFPASDDLRELPNVNIVRPH